MDKRTRSNRKDDYLEGRSYTDSLDIISGKQIHATFTFIML